MMFRLSKQDIRAGMSALSRCAERAYNEGKDAQAMSYVDAFTNLAGQFNLEYCDDRIEALLCKISQREINIIAAKDYIPNPNRWVFYDDFCTTYVLGLQWIDAMAKSGKEILYVTTRDVNVKNRNRSILPDIEKYPNVQICIIPHGDRFDRVQHIYNAIVHFNACKVVMHKHPSVSPIQLVLPILPHGIERYVINLSDQTFWLGVSAIDYCLEFRPFGASVSLQRRGLKREQLLMVPFYPANDLNPFAGYPKECTHKLVVFSGGDYYKTLDKKRTYWCLVKKLLLKYPEIVFLFATKNIPEGDSEIMQFIHDNHFEDRFIYINFRADIYQVFAHCDIYMGTCPTSGSLMSQLAAINGKPILQFYNHGTPDDETEQAICWNDNFSISFSNEDDFLLEADRLITDAVYRKKQGARIQQAMIQQDQFVEIVNKTLQTNKTQLPISTFKIDYEKLDDRWFYLEKGGYINTMPYLYGILGARSCFFYAPKVFLKKNWNRIVKRLHR